MSASENKAVFLSYASQDAEAARKICESLRAAGVEVWFDAEGGLEHGDEWDAKIRRQIKECVLFIPVISTNTQAREEGYFRIEWDLAAERARGFASGVAFILPIVVDDTREAEALVPDRFRAVQWTRLKGGEVPPEVKQRFLKLWSHRAGLLAHQAKQATAAGSDPVDRPASGAAGRTPGWLRPGRVALVVTAVVVLLGGWWWSERKKAPEEPARPAAAKAEIVESGSYRNSDLQRALKLIYSLDAIPEDFALAEDILKPLLATRPNDPEVVTVAAMVAQEYLTRGFDTSDARHALVQRLVERAVLLAPDNPDALGALSRYLAYMRMQLPRAEKLAQRAIELRPDEPRYYRVQLQVLVLLRPGAETDAFAARMVARFPTDALVRYDLARAYKDTNNVAAMERTMDETLALAPVAFAMVWKSWIMLEAHGDVAGMKTWLDRVPERQRTNTRVASALSVYGGISGETAPAIKLLNDLPDTWLSDFDFNGPKASLLGDLLAVDGRNDLARLQYEAALAEIKRAEVTNPTDLRARRAEMWTLLGLGRRDEAHAVLMILLESLTRPYRITLNNSWWSGSLRAALLLGERPTALALIKEAAAEPQSRLILRNQFHVDPRMAPLRDDPEIGALLAEPVEPTSEDGREKTAGSAAHAVDDKSVAVLAFANLSEDKENEYFSDGISEELLTVLQKIPGLHVTSRTSSFYFKGRNATTQEIGQKLAVANLVIGSVRKSGNQVRVSAQLCRAGTGEQVWSDSYTRDLKDVFALQTELAQTIVGQFRQQLGVDATDRFAAQVEAAEKGGTRNADAHQFYLQGRYYAVRFALEDLERAVSFFQKAVDLDPHYAGAWAALSQAASMMSGYANTRADFEAGNALASKAADRALALEPDLAVAHLAKGDLQTGPEFNWSGAQQSYRRALELAPNDAEVFADMGRLAYTLNQLDRSVDYFTRAERLDPANPAVRTYRAFALMAANRMAEAKVEFQEVIALNPSSPWSYGGMAWALALEGDFDQALQFAQKSALPWAQRFGLALAQSGRHDPAAAEAAVAEMIKLDAEVAAYQIAQIFAFRGDAGRAFFWLERAYQQRDPGLAWLRPDRLFHPIHGDSRWIPFLRKIGLADGQLP